MMVLIMSMMKREAIGDEADNDDTKNYGDNVCMVYIKHFSQEDFALKSKL